MCCFRSHLFLLLTRNILWGSISIPWCGLSPVFGREGPEGSHLS